MVAIYPMTQKAKGVNLVAYKPFVIAFLHKYGD